MKKKDVPIAKITLSEIYVFYPFDTGQADHKIVLTLLFSVLALSPLLTFLLEKLTLLFLDTLSAIVKEHYLLYYILYRSTLVFSLL
jgi:hypothetical protein